MNLAAQFTNNLYVIRIERNFWTLPFSHISNFQQAFIFKSYLSPIGSTKIVKVYKNPKK
jgi:hypothetical protein